MMKQAYTLYIYRADRRTKTGERLFSTTVWTGQDEDGMRRIAADMFDLYNWGKGWRFEYFPTMKTVKSLMTGQDVQIDRDTPWSCNPASESYWSA